MNASIASLRRTRRTRRIEDVLVAYFTLRWLIRMLWRGIRIAGT
jgi:hypothetical protein